MHHPTRDSLATHGANGSGPAGERSWPLTGGVYFGRMAVDVVSEIEIARPREEVAAYACDPDHATAWYENIKAVEWKSPRPAAIGSQIEFVAEFLRRRLVYTYEVREFVPGRRFVMSTSEGPFPMETTYTWEDAGDRASRMTLRNRASPPASQRWRRR